MQGTGSGPYAGVAPKVEELEQAQKAARQQVALASKERIPGRMCRQDSTVAPASVTHSIPASDSRIGLT